MAQRLCQLVKLLAVLAIFVPASASIARASCGDYLSHDAGLPNTRTAQPSEKQAPAPQPCHGPQCSSRQVPPLIPVAPAPSVRDWPVVMTVFVDLPQHTSGHRMGEFSFGIPSHSPSDIFHPPR
jgi:hypothetical protein